MTDREIGVAVLGLGNVGGEVVRLLADNAADYQARVGAPVVLRGVAVRSVGADRGVDEELLTTDAQALIDRDDVDVVVELIGGIEPARTLITSALAQGKSVVTANKALLADHGAALDAAVRAAGVDLYYEAAVAGAIPLIRPVRESLAGDRIDRVVGIVNGTTNFILSSMAASGAEYSDALAEASRLGYAEADPTADVEGYDAAAKAAILASLAFHTRVTAEDVYRQGISEITAEDLDSADAVDCTVKLLAICERVTGEDGVDRVSARVYPALLPKTHPLATVDGAFNAVFIEAEAAGRLMFYGQGAGGTPTASAVLGDLIAAARNKMTGTAGTGESTYAQLPIAPLRDTPTRYHVNMQVTDRPGVLAAVAEEFTRHGVSISVVRQEDTAVGASLVVLTHTARESDLQDTVVALGELEHVNVVTSVLRLEGTGE